MSSEAIHRRQKRLGKARLALNVAHTDQLVMPERADYFRSIETVYDGLGWL